MTKKLAQFTMLIVAAFAFTSCGDSKESIVDDMINTMNEASEASNSGDTKKFAELSKKVDELEKRGDELGIDDKFMASLPDSKKKALISAAFKFAAAKMKQMGPDIKETFKGLENIGK